MIYPLRCIVRPSASFPCLAFAQVLEEDLANHGLLLATQWWRSFSVAQDMFGVSSPAENIIQIRDPDQGPDDGAPVATAHLLLARRKCPLCRRRVNSDPWCRAKVDPLGQSEGVISVEDWAEIRRLHKSEKMPTKAIARELGVAWNTVRSALASDAPPRYQRVSAGSAIDVFEPKIRELLAKTPTMPATVIGERIGWVGSASMLRARVALLRPLYAPSDPAARTQYVAGETVLTRTGNSQRPSTRAQQDRR
ncbi:hypothetical protein GCM10022275_24470 [Tessaracoccus defluvii]